MKDVSKPHLFGVLAGLFLAAGLVASSMFATAAWLKVKNTQFINVKGSARRNVESDLAIWRESFSVEEPTLLESQRSLKAQQTKVEAFLNARGISNALFSSIIIGEIQATAKDSAGTVQQKTVGYRLTQNVSVKSENVDQIVGLDRESSELVEMGVLFTPEPISFLYTKSAEAKIEMLAEATRDARERAEQIAKQGQRFISQLHSADMGIFQITAQNAIQTSWEGMNDTTSQQKTITAVVTATFALK